MNRKDSVGRRSRQVVRIFRLGEEPRDDLRDSTTVEERLQMLRLLTERAWALGGQPLPSYSRDRIPVRVVSLADIEALGETP